MIAHEVSRSRVRGVWRRPLSSSTRPSGSNVSKRLNRSMSASAYGSAGYKDKVEALLGARAWRLAEQTEPFQTYPFVEEYAHLHHWISVYTKSEA